jgi:hypothetical protein
VQHVLSEQFESLVAFVPKDGPAIRPDDDQVAVRDFRSFADLATVDF